MKWGRENAFKMLVRNCVEMKKIWKGNAHRTENWTGFFIKNFSNG